MKHLNFSVVALLACTPLVASPAMAAGTNAAPSAKGQPHQGAPRVTQSSVASKTTHFATVAKTAGEVAHALDAHDQAKARLQVGKAGAFKGTVAKVFETRSVVILNFDEDYHKALTAVVKQSNFTKLPALKSLKGQTVLVSGKFVDFHGQPEIEVTQPGQIKLLR